MGVFSTMLNESEDFGFVAEELNVEDYANASIGDNIAEEAIIASVSIHNEHKSLIENLAAQEISAMEEGYEVVYEASSLSSIGDKIKSLIKKAIEKIKALFSKIVAIFSSWVKSDKDFIKKYQTQFVQNWNKMKKIDVNVYKYIAGVRNCTDPSDSVNHDELLTKFRADAAGTGSSSEKYNAYTLAKDFKADTTQAKAITGKIGDATDSGTSANDKFDAYKSKSDKEDTSDLYEDFRGYYFACIKAGAAKNSLGAHDGSNSKLSAKEFSDEIFEYLRSDNDSKESMDKSELSAAGYNNTDIIAVLSNNEKLISNLNKSWNKTNKQLQKLETEIGKILSKMKYNDATTAAENTHMAYVLTRASGLISLCLECATTYKGSFLQACKEYSRTCKTIATKVVAMGEKRLAQEESYDFGNDDYESSYGFMNSVVIK